LNATATNNGTIETDGTLSNVKAKSNEIRLVETEKVEKKDANLLDLFDLIGIIYFLQCLILAKIKRSPLPAFELYF
jgi:hypothetical protein